MKALLIIIVLVFGLSACEGPGEDKRRVGDVDFVTHVGPDGKTKMDCIQSHDRDMHYYLDCDWVGYHQAKELG